VATLPIIYNLTVANVAGHSKRTMASAIIAAAFSIGNIVGPQTFRNKDKPQYLPAKTAVMATQGGGALVTFILFLYYVWANKKKDSRRITEGAENWENKTDKENKTFRYVY
jgi:H+/gluconate symporter-like permease